MKIKRTIMILLLLSVVPLLSYTLEDKSGSGLIIMPLPRIWGLDLYLGLPFSLFSPDVSTVLWIEAGYGYEWLGFFREPGGEPYDGSASGFDPETSPYFVRHNIQLNLGLEQTLLWNEDLDTDLFTFFVFYRLKYDDYIQDENSAAQLLFSSDYPDREGIMQNSLLLGMMWHNLDRKHPHNIWSGTECEASVEFAPEFLANDICGRADFIRYNLTFRAFIPLFDAAPDTETNMLSAYCGIFFTIDYLTGEYIPINALQTVGGRRPKPGLGYTVRGIEARRFDSRLKAAGNLDLRFNLPEIGAGIIQPGCILYFDAGYYNFIDFAEQGILFTTGGGLFFNFFETLNICLYSQVLLNESLVRGGSFVPLAFELSFHF